MSQCVWHYRSEARNEREEITNHTICAIGNFSYVVSYIIID